MEGGQYKKTVIKPSIEEIKKYTRAAFIEAKSSAKREYLLFKKGVNNLTSIPSEKGIKRGLRSLKGVLLITLSGLGEVGALFYATSSSTPLLLSPLSGGGKTLRFIGKRMENNEEQTLRQLASHTLQFSGTLLETSYKLLAGTRVGRYLMTTGAIVYGSIKLIPPLLLLL